MPQHEVNDDQTQRPGDGYAGSVSAPRPPRLVQAGKWTVLAVIAGVIGGPLLGLLLLDWPPERVRDWARISLKDQRPGGDPSCDDPAWYRKVEIERAFPHHLPHPRNHPGKYTWDGDPETAWTQEFPSNDPGNDKVGWTLRRNKRVELVCVMGGWTRDTSTYNALGRPAKIRLTAPGCTTTKGRVANYAQGNGRVDARAWDYAEFRLKCEEDVPKVTLWIDSAHEGEGPWPVPGTRPEVAVSEVALYAGSDVEDLIGPTLAAVALVLIGGAGALIRARRMWAGLQ